MSASPGRPTLASVIFHTDLPHAASDPDGPGACSNCPHRPFVHSDRGRCRCLYAGCECPGLDRGPESGDLGADTPDGAETPAPVIALISRSYLVVAGGARPGRRTSSAG